MICCHCKKRNYKGVFIWAFKRICEDCKPLYDNKCQHKGFISLLASYELTHRTAKGFNTGGKTPSIG